MFCFTDLSTFIHLMIEYKDSHSLQNSEDILPTAKILSSIKTDLKVFFIIKPNHCNDFFLCP